MTQSLRERVEIAAEERRALLQRAVHDPGFPKARKRIAARIRKDMDSVLTAQGFAAQGKGVTWRRKGWWFDLAVDLQRSRYGYDAWINLTATSRLLGGQIQRRLGDFYPNPDPATDPGRLTYQALIEDPGLLAQPMQILQTRALPWLNGMGALIPWRMAQP